MARRGPTWKEVVVIAAAVCFLAVILFPVFARAPIGRGRYSTGSNARQLAIAWLMYSHDNDRRLPLMTNGRWGDLQNVGDDDLTTSGRRRTDAWPHLLLPYTKSKNYFVDYHVVGGKKDDFPKIWKDSAEAVGDPEFDPRGNTYRNQSRFPMFGVNYAFLAPLVIQPSGASMDEMIGKSRSFEEADSPEDTILLTTSKLFDRDRRYGFFGVNAPGIWSRVASDDTPYVVFWSGSPCSGDWCANRGPSLDGSRFTTNSVRFELNGGSVFGFLDGHVKYLKAPKVAAGTNFLRALPNDGGVPGSLGGGAVITDKSKYRWNLDDEFMP